MHKIIHILLIAISCQCYAQSADTTAMIEKIFSRYSAENPGCQLSVSRNGTILFSKAWGKANMEDGTALTMHSLIEAGSVSKQFTAACILLLEQQGKLSLQDDVRKYIPEIPVYETMIKIKYLIHHSSGIKDWGTVAELTGFGRGSKAYRNEDALEIIARQKTLNNVPGAEFIYSNSNFNLLAILVQRVSGMSLADYSKKYIFDPAGMTQTQWRDDYKRIVPNRAIAYNKTETGYETDMPNEYVYGNGGLLTTTEDLLKWNDFFLSGKLGQPSLLPKQTGLDTLNNSQTNYYAAGLFIQTSRGKKVIRHNGATASYRANLSYYPDLKLSIAWLSNTSQFDTARYDAYSEVEDLFIKRPPATHTEDIKDISVPAEKLQRYAGWYRNSRTAGGLQLVFVNNQLLIDNRTVIHPVAEGRFRFGKETLQFGSDRNFQWITEDKDSVDYAPTLSAETNLKDTKLYTGKYFSEEADTNILVSEKKDGLYISLNSYTSFRLQPLYRDAFRIVGFGGILQFSRMKSDEIRQFRIFQGRARNVLFTKTN